MGKILRAASAMGVCMALVPLAACGQNTDEAQRSAGLTPESAVAFVSLSLSPSVEQQTNLIRFANTVGDRDLGFESSKDDAARSFVEDNFGQGLSYEQDFKPWIGSEVAVAVFADVPEDSNDDFGLALIVDVTDDAVAEEALRKIKDVQKDEADAELEWQIFEGKAVIVDVASRGSDDAWVLERFRALQAGDGKSLATVDRFSELDDQLASDRLGYAYLDVQRLQTDARGLQESGCDFNSVAGGSIMTAVRAEPDAVRLQVAASGAQSSDRVSDRLGRLPDGTVGAFSLATGSLNLRQVFGENAINCDDLGLTLDYDEVFGDFEDETGVDVQRYVADWFSGDISLVLGSGTSNQDQAVPNEFGLVAAAANIEDKSARLEESIEQFEAIARYQLAQDDCTYDFDLDEVVCTDPDDVELPFTFVETRIDGAELAYEVRFDDESQDNDIAPVFAVSNDAFVVASTPAYAERLLGDGDSSPIAEIGSQVLDGDGNVTFAGVVDLDQTADFAEELIGDDDSADTRAFFDGLRRFNTFEFSARNIGSVSVFDGKLSLDE